MKTRSEIASLLDELSSTQQKEREEAVHQLYALNEEHPESLYPFWDSFAEMLRGPEVSKRYWAIHMIANLVSVDADNRFDCLIYGSVNC